MTIQFDAIYEGGVLRPISPISLPDGSAVRVLIQSRDNSADPLAAVIGVGEGPPAGDVADRHDDYLHGNQK